MEKSSKWWRKGHRPAVSGTPTRAAGWRSSAATRNARRTSSSRSPRSSILGRVLRKSW